MKQALTLTALTLTALTLTALTLAAVVGVVTLCAIGRMPMRFIGALFLDASLVTQLAMLLLVLVGLAVAAMGAIAVLGRSASMAPVLMIFGWAAVALGVACAAFGVMNTFTVMQSVSRHMGQAVRLDIIAPSLAESVAVAGLGCAVATLAAWSAVAARARALKPSPA